MNSPELISIARHVELENRNQFRLRVKFGIACVERVEYLIIDSEVIDSLAVGKRYVAGECSETVLNSAAKKASSIARSHPGTNSFDGAGSAAVSSSHGVAAALEGRALDAAGYSAYASVYSYSSHAVTDPDAYEKEHSWQVAKLKELVISAENERAITHNKSV